MPFYILHPCGKPSWSVLPHFLFEKLLPVLQNQASPPAESLPDPSQPPCCSWYSHFQGAPGRAWEASVPFRVIPRQHTLELSVPGESKRGFCFYLALLLFLTRNNTHPASGLLPVDPTPRFPAFGTPLHGHVPSVRCLPDATPSFLYL